MEEIYNARKVEQINDCMCFIDTYKSNKIEIGLNEMTVMNDSEMCVRWNNEALLVNTGNISPEIVIGEYRLYGGKEEWKS